MDSVRVFFSQARAVRGTNIVREREGRCSEIRRAMLWTVVFWHILKVLASMSRDCCERSALSRRWFLLERTVRKPSFSFVGGWPISGLGCEVGG